MGLLCSIVFLGVHRKINEIPNEKDTEFDTIIVLVN